MAWLGAAWPGTAWRGMAGIDKKVMCGGGIVLGTRRCRKVDARVRTIYLEKGPLSPSLKIGGDEKGMWGDKGKSPPAHVKTPEKGQIKWQRKERTS